MTQMRVAGRQPRGWEQIVGQLNAAEDPGAFARGMLELQCRIVAAQYGALWAPGGQDGPNLLATWPATLADGGLDAPVMQMLRQAAAAGLEREFSQVLTMGLGPDSGAAGGGHVFVTVMRAGGGIAAISTVVAEVRDPQVIASTAPLRELAAGLYEGFAARRAALAKAAEADQVRQTMAVLAVTQDAPGFSGACMNLVNELSRQLGCERVSLGWIKARSLRLVAMSDTDQVHRHSETAQDLEVAMAECLDQEQPIVYPLPQDAEPLLAQAVVFSHRKLVGGPAAGSAPSPSAGAATRCVLSVPLRHRDQWVGVLTLERGGPAFDAASVQRLQLLADVVTPQLADRREADRWLFGHAWQSLRRGAGFVVGPRHVGWKLLAALVLVLLVTLSLMAWPYHVSAPFRLEAHSRRIVPAMYEGRIARVLAQPGDEVDAGALLAELDTRELALQLVEAQSRLRMAQIERDQAGAEGKRPEAARADANARQIQARIDLLQDQITRAAIRSPVRGVVLAGYWHDKVGGVVEQGTALFEIAPRGDLTAVVRVSEADVHQLLGPAGDAAVVPAWQGRMATRAEPQRVFDIRVERIVPLAKPVEGDNVFEVWCRIDQAADWLRPGMEGRARLAVGTRPVVWILTRKLIATARLWLWW